MVTVQVRTTPTFSAGTAKVLFPAGGYRAKMGDRRFDVAPDDKRFLMIRPVSGAARDRVIVAENWFEDVKSKPAK